MNKVGASILSIGLQSYEDARGPGYVVRGRPTPIGIPLYQDSEGAGGRARVPALAFTFDHSDQAKEGYERGSVAIRSCEFPLLMCQIQTE